jgi:hypothetical protein
MPVQPWSELMAAWLAPFRTCLTEPSFRHALVLVTGALLTPGRRTVTAMLTVVGLAQAPTFTNYHRVLNRNHWSSREVARRLLTLLIAAFVPTGPVVIGLDDTLERRWGARIAARGIYRDPIRSSHGHFVKASGLRWLSFMLLTPLPWTDRVWALPFLTVLAPSERFSREHCRRHKALTDWARQGLLQIARWLPERRLVAVADMSYAAIELLSAVREHVCMITRLRLDARLFAPPAPRIPGTIGRPRIVGERLPTLAERLADPRTPWRRLRIDGWYGGGERLVEVLSGRPSGITRASTLQSGMFWCAMSRVHSGRRLSCAQISMPTRSRSCGGLFVAGRPRSPLRKCGGILGWRRSVSGPTRRLRAHPGSARPVLARGPMDQLRRCSPLRPRPAHDLVRERDDHVQRCSRRGTPGAVGQRAFQRIIQTAQYRQRTRCPRRTLSRSTLLPRLKGQSRDKCLFSNYVAGWVVRRRSRMRLMPA